MNSLALLTGPAVANPKPCADGCGAPAADADGVIFTRLNESRGRVQLVEICRSCAAKRDAEKAARR